MNSLNSETRYTSEQYLTELQRRRYKIIASRGVGPTKVKVRVTVHTEGGATSLNMTWTGPKGFFPFMDSLVAHLDKEIVILEEALREGNREAGGILPKGS